MLRDLRVKNFALIEELEINFDDGLNVLSGETGTGKSIVIGALEMLLGARASSDVVRSDKKCAYIEAVFEPRQLEKINKIINQSGIETEESIILLSREIKLNGRNRCRINGQLATLGMIRKISQYFVDIHGQHQHQSLLDKKIHLQLLDDYICDDIGKLKNKIKSNYENIEEIENKLNNMEIDPKEKSRKLDLLNHQIKEIEQAKLKPGEYINLEKDYKKLNNMEQIYTVTGSIQERINGEDYNTSSILDIMGNLMSELENIKEYDSSLHNFYDDFENIFYQLQDLPYEINNYHQNLEYNQQKLIETEERINLINELKRKYGENIKEISAYKDKLQQKVDKLVSREEQIERLNKRKEKLSEEYYQQAEELTNIRTKRARELEKEIMYELRDLAMENTLFKIDFKEKSWSADGIDRIEFLIRPNPGEELKSLTDIASGGELSRIMLALKTIIADIDKVDTLIFDEVDKGVGGKTAQKMAEKMVKISRRRQVICITHLPQIASMSDNHFYISKETNGKKTQTKINNLQREGKKNELARMLGGVEITKATLKHAEEMLKMAESKKEQI